MTARHEAESLKWYRFSDYVIEEDGLITPTRDATPIAYDPWSNYRAATRGISKQPGHRGSKRGEPHYLRLVRLGDKLRSAVDRYSETCALALDEAQRGAVIEFARATGLLGIFHHTVTMMATPGCIWNQRGGLWVADTSNFPVIAGGPVCIGLSMVGATTPQVVRYDDVAGKFFGAGMPEMVPHPISLEFFEHYHEPILDFAIAAVIFAEAVRGLWEGVTDGIDDLRAGGIFTKTTARRDAKHRVVGGEEEIFASLLHAFSEQCRRDFMAGFRVMTCPGCGELLRTNYARTMYCSEQCRWKVVRRNQRSKEKAGRRAK